MGDTTRNPNLFQAWCTFVNDLPVEANEQQKVSNAGTHFPHLRESTASSSVQIDSNRDDSGGKMKNIYLTFI